MEGEGRKEAEVERGGEERGKEGKGGREAKYRSTPSINSLAVMV